MHEVKITMLPGLEEVCKKSFFNSKKKTVLEKNKCLVLLMIHVISKLIGKITFQYPTLLIKWGQKGHSVEQQFFVIV